MSRKVDVEVRVVMTGLPSGLIEWYVARVEDTGQTTFEDTGTLRYERYDAREGQALQESVWSCLRSAAFAASLAQFDR